MEVSNAKVDLTNQLTDVEIAANTKLRPVKDVASDLGLPRMIWRAMANTKPR